VNKGPLALLIQEASADPGPVREAVTRDVERPVRLQCVAQFSTALARIAGGDIDVVLLDLSASGEGGLASLQQLLREAPRLPIVVLCGAGREGLALQAMRAGAAGYLTKEQLGPGVCRALHSAVELARNTLPPAGLEIFERRAEGSILAFLGSKGGVGTTTVALNIASVLARRSTVILAEMRPTFGSLAPYLQPGGPTRNLSHLLNSELCSTGSTETAASLWACKKIPGLSVLFGPQTADQCAEIEPGQALAITQGLKKAADYVVVDLPASLSAANRAIAELSTSTVLVVELDPVCVRSASLIARALESWSGVPQPVGAIIVNRASAGCPMPLPEIETLLRCQVMGVIPPSADLCLSAENKGAPLVAIHPESLMAGSLNDIVEALAPPRSAVPLRSVSHDRFRNRT
jgi:pilus assembly protein CpaE